VGVGVWDWGVRVCAYVSSNGTVYMTA